MKLLPCPFCGNDKNIGMANENHDHSGGYFIACPECGASTSLRYALGDDPAPLLIEQWNRRATLPPAIAAGDSGAGERDKYNIPPEIEEAIEKERQELLKTQGGSNA